jgi:8-oxo-dGTP diphosphatase
MKPDVTLYVSQKALVRKGRQVLLLNDPDLGLDFPGGKLQDGEVDLIAALRREVREETGLEIEVEAPFAVWLDDCHRLALQTGKPVLVIGYRCQYVAGEVGLSAEHDGWRWIDRASLMEVDDGSSYFAVLKA